MFENFPINTYQFEGEQVRNIIDFYHRFDFFYEYYKKNTSYFKEYVIKDHETPESLSSKFFNNKKYWFILLLINNRSDPFFDWVLTNDEITLYAEKFVKENPIEVNSYILKHPHLLDSLSNISGTNVVEYNPIDPKDENNIIVKYMIDYYYGELIKENDSRRHIFIPDKNMMKELYNTYMKMSNDL